MTKPNHWRVQFKDEAQFEIARGGVLMLRASHFEKWGAICNDPAADPGRVAFHRKGFEDCDAVLALFSERLQSDKSQDPQPDENDDED